ncbi:hypothetical protein JG687_00018006 [Phytophthora cactorum]|uniref:Uncharacterized protein n=1 Tax=Phytophthora cactorum TaxID=29920 RepID=A0A8T1TQM5_9STRA|nr:hypothetical protein JG687_00018006 [Phytophthora cactorum]
MEEEVMNTQLPPQLHCRLSITSGEPLTPCHDRLPRHKFGFMVRCSARTYQTDL